jgi:hypothetical protein
MALQMRLPAAVATVAALLAIGLGFFSWSTIIDTPQEGLSLLFDASNVTVELVQCACSIDWS